VTKGGLESAGFPARFRLVVFLNAVREIDPFVSSEVETR